MLESTSDIRDFTLVKAIFYLATLFARREPKTRIRQRDWLKLRGEKIRREQVGTVPTFLSVAKWKIGLWRRRQADCYQYNGINPVGCSTK